MNNNAENSSSALFSKSQEVEQQAPQSFEEIDTLGEEQEPLVEQEENEIVDQQLPEPRVTVENDNDAAIAPRASIFRAAAIEEADENEEEQQTPALFARMAPVPQLETKIDVNRVASESVLAAAPPQKKDERVQEVEEPFMMMPNRMALPQLDELTLAKTGDASLVKREEKEEAGEGVEASFVMPNRMAPPQQDQEEPPVAEQSVEKRQEEAAPTTIPSLIKIAALAEEKEQPHKEELNEEELKK